MQSVYSGKERTRHGKYGDNRENDFRRVNETHLGS